MILYSKNYSSTITFSLFAGILKIQCISRKISLNYQNLGKFEAFTQIENTNLRQNGFKLLEIALIISNKRIYHI